MIERINPSDPEHPRSVIEEHLARYAFASPFCYRRKVADIACGLGYGTEQIGATGYDKEDFFGNKVVDLEKSGWEEQYDLIVSFETIEHLANPEFFLSNCAKSAPQLLVSTPINEPPGHNPFHKQFWNAEQFLSLLRDHYSHLTVFYQTGKVITTGIDSGDYIIVLAEL